MDRIIFHIGMHKTGTSSIQQFMAAAADDLLQEGILYPMAGRRDASATGQHVLAWSARKKFDTVSDASWHALRRELTETTARTAVISSEFFWPSSREQVQQIRQYLEGFPVEIVLYYRRHFAYMVSEYKQVVKYGQTTKTFRRFAEENLAWCDYADTHDRWASVFGEEHVTIRFFDKAKKGGLLNDFAGIVGFDPARYEGLVQQRANTSPPDTAIRALLLLNRMQQVCRLKRTHLINRMRWNIVSQGRTGNTFVAFVRPFIDKPLYSESDEVWFREATKEMRARFLSQHVPTEDRALFEG